MSIILPPYFHPNVPTPNITPFTYRDGVTYLQRLERLVKYINTTLVEGVNENTEAIVTAFNAAVEKLTNDLINESIELQDPVMREILENSESLSRQYLNILLSSVIQEDPNEPGTYLIMEPPIPAPESGEVIPDPENPGYWIVGD